LFKVANAEIAIAARRARERFFSRYREWGSQISSDLEHNKRYLPDSRTRGRIGMVRFGLTMNCAG